MYLVASTQLFEGRAVTPWLGPASALGRKADIHSLWVGPLPLHQSEPTDNTEVSPVLQWAARVAQRKAFGSGPGA